MHEIIQGEYPSDRFVKFYGDEFFEHNEGVSVGNCFSFRFIFSAPDDAVIACNCDGTNGSRLIYESNRIKVVVVYNSVEYIMQSNILQDNVYYFVEIYVNLQNGIGKVFINGIDDTDTNSITGIGDISNNESLKIGGTNVTGLNTGIITIGNFSYWTQDNWFDSNSGFVSEYNDYILYKLNNSFPIGGPNAYQLISEDKQSYLQTPPSAVNLIDDITVENVTVGSLLSFNPLNYESIDSPVDGFSITGSGADVLYEQVSEFQDDSSVLVQDGKYLLKDEEFTGIRGDFAIEAVFRKDPGAGTAWIFGYGDSSGAEPQIRLGLLDSTTDSISLYIRDDNFNSISYSYGVGSIDFNIWNHLFIIYRKATGQLSFYINGTRIQTSIQNILTGDIYYASREFRIGSVDGQSANDQSINISMFKLYEY